MQETSSDQARYALPRAVGNIVKGDENLQRSATNVVVRLNDAFVRERSLIDGQEFWAALGGYLADWAKRSRLELVIRCANPSCVLMLA
jgi:hypothetical protein